MFQVHAGYGKIQANISQRMHHPRLAAASVLLGLASALPAFAAAGDATAIELRDLNLNGRIDQVVVSVANPDRASWSVNGPAGFGLAYDGRLLPITAVYVASAPSADPVRIEIAVNEDDPLVPRTTDGNLFELSYVPSGAPKGVAAGMIELSAIAEGDTGAHDTELDRAAPLLLDSLPRNGMYDFFRAEPLTLTFSEPIAASTFAFLSARDPGEWATAWAGSAATIQHRGYPEDIEERFEVKVARDLAGNDLVQNGYPNPFTFRTATGTAAEPKQDTAFLLTAPAEASSLVAGEPAVIAWHSTTTGITKVRISYSTNFVSYETIAELPVEAATYVWYPPNKPGTLSLRLEGLSASGLATTAVFSNTSSIAASPTMPPVSVLVPVWAYPGQDTTRIGVGLDRRPALVSLSCSGAVVPGLRVTGVRPIRVEADVVGLATDVSHACKFSLTDAFGRVSEVAVPSFRIETAASPAGPALSENALIKGSGAAVYWYKGGKRSAFPNETVYRSWFGTSFSNVVVLTDAELAAIPLGRSVTMKEGTYFVKIQSDPATYAVEPNGVLRWIRSEDEARRLYGLAWAARVRDIDVSLFVDYTIGQPLAIGETPAGHQP